jgi:hypothetical protein
MVSPYNCGFGCSEWIVGDVGFAFFVSNAIGVLCLIIMRIQYSKLLFFTTLTALTVPVLAQQPAAPKPQDTEVWVAVPKIVTPGASDAAPPSDAIVLFDGKNLDEWVSAQDKSPAKWIVADGVLTVSKAPGVGNIETKRGFRNYQLHIEWKIPENITGTDQARDNSGVFLASTGPGDAGYELQVLDSYIQQNVRQRPGWEYLQTGHSSGEPESQALGMADLRRGLDRPNVQR